MSQKCIKISICFSFLTFTCGLCFLCFRPFNRAGHFGFGQGPILTFANPEAGPYKKQYKCLLDDLLLKRPSLESLIQASSAVEGQDLHFRGLAVFSNLTHACQPPVDVSKSNIQVNKIAFITIADKKACSLWDMAVNAQNAGYSVVVYFTENWPPNNARKTHQTLLIPVLYSVNCDVIHPIEGNTNVGNDPTISPAVDETVLFDADRSNAEIMISGLQNTDALSKMQKYLERLYYWFLFGPVITLEWLRRTKKFCFMSSDQQVNEEHRTFNEDEDTVGETNQHSVIEETRGNDDQEMEHEQTGDEEEPLIIVVNEPHANRTTTGNTGYQAIRRVTTPLANMFGKFAVGCGYVILIVAALPVGISSGGLSFFRFDENENVIMFWGDEAFAYKDPVTNATVSRTFSYFDPLYQFFSLWWSPLQIYCFFLYSWFSCKATWTVPANFSKPIRSDWFASNIYLLILGLVVPYCSFDVVSGFLFDKFIYFTTYNMVCTISNLLFIIILNKHKFVTRYVFYISVCMICAYIESDIVAVFYFMLNSEGSLVNLKLVALRTVAIGLTLTLSFSSSMHIIRKLAKPQESLFEGLSEK